MSRYLLGQFKHDGGIPQVDDPLWGRIWHRVL